MTEVSKGIRSYIIIFAWLGAVTLLEMGAVAMGMPRKALVIFILGTAAAKALLIALFFMHLKYENKWLWLMPGIPVALAVFFILMLFPDMVYHLTLRLGWTS